MDTYLVRIWRPAPDSRRPPAGLCGTVLDLHTQVERTFHDPMSLLAMLRRDDETIPLGPVGS